MMSLKRLKKDFCDEMDTIIVKINTYEKHILR